MVTYLEAREPAVNLAVKVGISGLGVVDLVKVPRARVAGVTPGVARPVEREGVALPLTDGVTRPLNIEVDGVTRPDMAGVMRPLREEVTEGGRGMAPKLTVGEESLAIATKTPQ